MEHTTQARKVPEKRACCECGKGFDITDPHRQHSKRFCCDAHAQAFANRQTTRGKVMAAATLAWRGKRGGGEVGKAALAELCAMADQFNDEDRKAKRPPVADYFASLAGQGYRFVDRQRRSG